MHCKVTLSILDNGMATHSNAHARNFIFILNPLLFNPCSYIGHPEPLEGRDSVIFTLIFPVPSMEFGL